jgi:hypothetical protein
MKRKIVTDRGESITIARTFGCTVQMVSDSLNFRKNSPLARKIRKTALERGGVDTSKLTVNN